jgi:hypothetical protein
MVRLNALGDKAVLFVCRKRALAPARPGFTGPRQCRPPAGLPDTAIYTLAVLGAYIFWLIAMVSSEKYINLYRKL